MTLTDLSKQLERLEYLLQNKYIQYKDVLTLDETSVYLGLSKQYLYKLTSGKRIPCYCPQGKKLYFKKSDLDDWMLRNRQSTKDELDQIAVNYLLNKKAPFAKLAREIGN